MTPYILVLKTDVNAYILIQAFPCSDGNVVLAKISKSALTQTSTYIHFSFFYTSPVPIFYTFEKSKGKIKS